MSMRLRCCWHLYLDKSTTCCGRDREIEREIERAEVDIIIVCSNRN